MKLEFLTIIIQLIDALQNLELFEKLYLLETSTFIFPFKIACSLKFNIKFEIVKLKAILSLYHKSFVNYLRANQVQK